MDELKKIGENKWWDVPNRTLYVRQSASMADLAGHITQYRQELSREPNDLGLRYMLAGCLYGDGQVGQARSEWEQVAASEDADWASLAQEALERMGLGDNQ